VANGVAGMSTASQHPFNPKLVVGLILAGIAAFAALLLLIAYGGGGSGSSRDGRAHALAVSAVGYKGLVSLVGQFHETYLIREANDFNTENLVIISLEPTSRPEDLRRVLDQRRGRATLIILPKWITMPDPARRGWVRAVMSGAGQIAAQAIGNVAVDVSESGAAGARHGRTWAEGENMLAGFRMPVPVSPQTISGADLTPLIGLPGPVAGKPGVRALVAQLGDQPHYVLADPDLVNNHGLADAETARAALALIDRLNATDAGGVDFDLTVNGIGGGNAPSLLRLAFEPPFLAMTLALVIAALLAGLHGAFRFGPIRREQRAIAFGKAALVENSAGLIRQAEREAALGSAYADVVRQEVARTTGAPPWLQEGELDLYLDRLGRADQASFSELAAELHLAGDRHRLMAAARKLFAWKKEIIR